MPSQGNRPMEAPLSKWTAFVETVVVVVVVLTRRPL